MASPATEKEWTIIVYMAGDNNLTDECVFALTEMKKADLDDNLNILVQFDPNGSRLPTRRLKIKKDPRPGTLGDDAIDVAPFKLKSSHAITSQRIRTADPVPVDETDTGDPNTLFNFISLCIERFPAKHYMVVLSGHGAGTGRDFLLRDDSPSGYLTMYELQEAFQNVKDKHGVVIDILGMDVCLMSMAEVCYELDGRVRIIVGSESYSPSTGWPYRQILGRLVESLKTEGAMEPSDFARAIVEEYVNFYLDYQQGGLSVDQSALDVSKSGALAAAMKELAYALRGELLNANLEVKERFKDAITLAHWEAQSYNGELFVDLLDFCECLLKRYPLNDIPAKCQAVMDVISQQSFVIRSCYSGPAYQYSNGVSIYFPWSDIEASYRNLAFTQETVTGWFDFLLTYTEETRRLPRGFTPEKRAENLASFASTGENLLSPGISTLKFRMGSGRMGSGRMGSGREGGNPISSMRNPPIDVSIDHPSECIRDKDVFRAAQSSAYTSKP